ncbi:SDR family NAD(P)-dependent oxidoreductase [Roseisalinus antarcticus]|uniref:Gluconate 5-dehydrogenase n=1 Tax=Roseisalinus antarcticus TaxID=254357 RepID=A0A1Y5TU72_9RHOB|nr:SDR family oxidoreductase [Roseisalinus antarcticus]SLN72600.1 Gluconate 5-dehydrogenase [Roseisalinus antarcticus]
MHGHSAKFADLSGASVFISGGGSGIGAALTRGFLEQGAHVAFIGRSDYSAFTDEVARETGLRPLAIRGDVTDTARLQAAIGEAEAAHGPLDVLINNAANDQRLEPMDVKDAEWDAMQAINLKHFFFASQRAAETMRGRGGRIVNLSSIVSTLGSGELAVYATAKAGIVGLTRSLSRAWGPDGIRVNALLPGMVLTQRQLDLWIDDEARDSMLARQDIKHAMSAEDMVGPTLFLASDASRMITGQCLIADGGVVSGT